MASPASRAEEFKLKGNSCFQKKDYLKAECLYSQAIICDPTNAAFFTNRALARSKLEKWSETVEDCRRALELLPTSLKANHYLGLGLLRMGKAAEALKYCLRAYELAIEQKSPSAPSIVEIVLEAKKKRWEAREKERISKEAQLLEEAVLGLEKLAIEKKEQLRRAAKERGSESQEWDVEDEIAAVSEETDRMIIQLRDVFAMSDERHRIRLVPEHLIDPITFSIMVDPVVTPHGTSYDRATISEHLRRSNTDPLTRQTLTEKDLYSNKALKTVCEEFLDQNGWVVDW